MKNTISTKSGTEIIAAKVSPRKRAGSIQLSARVPDKLHADFYAACAARDVSGSDMLRTLMESFVVMAAESNA